MTDAFKTHPQPRTFAPSKEDVLHNLQYFCALTPQRCTALCTRARACV